MAFADAEVKVSELKVEINTKNLQFALKFFPQQLKVELADGFDHISRKFLSTFFKNRLRGRPGITARPGGLKTKFSRSLLVAKELDGMGIRILGDSNIAVMHEEGAVLRNPSGGKLAVPLSKRTEMFTSSGRLKKQYRKPRAIRNVIQIEVNGKQFLAKKKSKKSSEIKPLFVLKNNIKIKPRLGFYNEWDSMLNTNIEILNKSIQKAIDKST